MATMRSLFTIALFLMTCPYINAQVFISPVTNDSDYELQAEDSVPARLTDQLNVHQDERLENMLKGHIENNKNRNGMEGFRIEIFFSSTMNAKEEAFRIKKEFLAKYPEENVHIKYIAPNFRVRAGDFRTRNEALKVLNAIKEDYPGAFIVPDIIQFPLLKQEAYE